MKNVEILLSSLGELIKDFQYNPFDFLYERDLQAHLFSIGYRKFSKDGIVIRGGHFKEEAYASNGAICTVPIKCEYPSSHLFDIALIDHKRIENFDPIRAEREKWKNDRFWNQPIRAAIEIKYYQLGDRLPYKTDEFEKDIKKLQTFRNSFPEFQFLGIAIIFIQSSTLKAEAFRGEQDASPAINNYNHIFRCVVTKESGLQAYAT